MAPVLTRQAPRASVAGGAVSPVPQRGHDERDQGGAHQHRGHRQVDEGDEGEDEDRRGHGHDELGQELAEVDLELLHAFHHRGGHGSGALVREVGGPEAHEMVVQPPAEPGLHAERGVVRDHRAGVLDQGPGGDHEGDGGDGEGQGRQAGARQHAGQEPAEQREPGDSEHDAHQAERGGHDDARAKSEREAEEGAVEVHVGPEDSGYRP
jgi:hypothetical protein